jgi:hypothetical protein
MSRESSTEPTLTARGTTITRSIEIDATPAVVWQALTDTASYPQWNGFITKLEGDLTVGKTLHVRIHPPNGRAMTFKPKVLTVESEHELRWLGRFLVPGLFDGEHSFRIDALPEGRSRFTQSEQFTGLLVGPFKKMLGKTSLGFDDMNTSLKERVEAVRS